MFARFSSLIWFRGQHRQRVVKSPTENHIDEGGVLDYDKLARTTRRTSLEAAHVASFLIVDVAARPRP